MSEPNRMEFPDTFEEYVKIYGIKDSARIYTNGSILIPALRVQQWIEHIRPKGKWIKDLIKDLGNGWVEVCFKDSFKCSSCGLHFDFSTNFCPNCGADMRGTE